MSGEDVTARAEQFEKKLARAGSTDDIITGLVKGLERNQKIVKYLTISIILDIALSLTLGVLAGISWVQGNTIEDSNHRIDALGHQTCERSNSNSVAINDFLDIIIEGYKSGQAKGVPPDIVKKQIMKYQDMKVEVLKC